MDDNASTRANRASSAFTYGSSTVSLESGSGSSKASSVESPQSLDPRDTEQRMSQQQLQIPHPSAQPVTPKGPGQPQFENRPLAPENKDFWSFYVLILAQIAVVLTFPLSIWFCIKTVNEYERAVILRLGRILEGRAKGPGVFWVNPFVDEIIKVDYRTISFDVPPQELLTQDHVTISVDAVVYYRVVDAVMSVVNIVHYGHAVNLLSTSILRNNLGTRTLSNILTARDDISREMQSLLDIGTDPWGIKVERVEIKDVRLPTKMQRAMAAEAESTREAKAKVISATGEKSAAVSLRDAADEMAKSTYAIQLRYLQTMASIATERESTVYFPVPLNF